MTDEQEGWDDLDDVLAPAPSIVERIDWALVTASLNGGVTIAKDASETSASDATPDRPEQPETDASASGESSDALTLFGSPEQFHVAWQHWNGMPEFHMDDLSPDSTLVVKFRTTEDREAFAALIGRPIRREESRGIWYPEIRIARFWDKVYVDHTSDSVDSSVPHKHTRGPVATPSDEAALSEEEEAIEAVGRDESEDASRVGEET